MLSGRIAGRYAEALFDLAQQQGTTATWEAELASLAQVMEVTPELREVLTHPEIALQRKEAVVQQSFQGKIAREVLALLFLLLKRGHDPDMRTIHTLFRQRWDQARQVLPVSVTSAVALSAEQVQALAQALARRTGKAIQLEQFVDPDLLAGLVVRMEDRVIDASARATLEALRESMRGG